MIEKHPSNGGCPVPHHHDLQLGNDTSVPRQTFDLPALEINPILPPGKTMDELFNSGPPRYSHETMARFPIGNINMIVATVSTHPGAIKVLENKEGAFSQEFAPQADIYQQFFREPNNGGPWAYDPPALHDVRKIMGRDFRPAKVRQQHDNIQAECQETLETFLRQHEPGHIDVAEYARTAAMRVAAQFVGIDDINRYGPKFAQWIRKFNTAASLASLPQQPGKRFGLRMIVDERMRRLRDPDDPVHGREDLLNTLINHYKEGTAIGERRVRRNDLTALVWSAFAATTDTVSVAAVNSILFSSQIPGALEAMRGNPALVEAVSDEARRYYPPFPHPFEKVIADTVVDETAIKQGQWVRVSLGGAHRDSSVFSEPNLFDVNRPNHAEHNISFGAGPHSCLGWYLGKVLTENIVQTLVDNLHITPGGLSTYTRIASPIVHRIDTAPMTYHK